MSDISFGSTYRIPITQAGVNSAKKARLKTLIESYPNGLIGKSKTGHARVSVPDSEDADFLGKLKAIGYKVYQKFEGDNISKENLDSFIKEKLDTRDFSMKGKQASKMSKELRAQRRFDRNYTPAAFEKVTSDVDTVAEEHPFNDVKSKVVSDSSKFIINKDNIRKSATYLDLKEKYGEDFAEAVFFGVK